MKYAITILITALVVFAGAYVYFKGFPTFPSYNKAPVSTQSAETIPVQTPTALATSSPASTTTVKAGGVLVFKAYTIDVPSDWQSTHQSSPSADVQMDKLILTKGAYSISIYEAATGGAQCLYPGDPDSEMSTRFTTFTDITTQTGDKLRRGGTGTGGFTVCEKQSGGSWGLPTSFGHISIQAPASPTPQMLNEIDSILSSLKKV